MTVVLRDYQIRGIDGIYGAWEGDGKRSVLFSAPTGAGKTVIAAELMRKNDTGTSWFAVHLNILAWQTLERMAEYGLDCGLVQANNTSGISKSRLVCSSQTLRARDWARLGKWSGCTSACRENCDGLDCNALYEEEFDLDRAHLPDLFVIDEAHIGHKEPRRIARAVVANGGRVVGFTATPYADYLYRQYDALVTTDSTAKMASEGHLVPPRIFRAKDMFDITKTDGTEIKPQGKGESADWSAAQVRKALIEQTMGELPDIYQEHVRKLYGKDAVPTLVFVPLIAIADQMAADWSERLGIGTAVISANDGKDGRPSTDEVLRRFDSGEVQIVFSVFKTALGFDRPYVQCIVLARMMASITVLAQTVGRGLRPSPGKIDCLVLDHGMNMRRLGPLFDHHYDPGPQAIEPPRRREPGGDDALTEKECPECHAYIPIGTRTVCPECGADISKKVEIEADGDVEMEEYHIDSDYYVDPRLAKYVSDENAEALWYTLSCQSLFELEMAPQEFKYPFQRDSWLYTQTKVRYLLLKTPPDHYGCPHWRKCSVAPTATKCGADPYHPFQIHPAAAPWRMPPELSELLERARNRERRASMLRDTPLALRPRSVRCEICGEFSALKLMENPKNTYGLYMRCRSCRTGDYDAQRRHKKVEAAARSRLLRTQGFV